MSAYQWLLSQQDNYNGEINQVEIFKADLYLNFNSSSFMYCIHDKEKDLHIHCVLRLNVGMTKKQLLEIFPNADIRVQRADNKGAWEYLTHRTKRSIEEKKTLYDLESIVYHNFDDFDEWILLKPRSKDKTDIELLDDIVNDILDGELTCFREVLSKYKGVALKYSNAINNYFDNFK